MYVVWNASLRLHVRLDLTVNRDGLENSVHVWIDVIERKFYNAQGYF